MGIGVDVRDLGELLRDYVGQMVNGAGDVVQQLQSQLQGQSGDQTGIQRKLELRQSQVIDSHL